MVLVIFNVSRAMSDIIMIVSIHLLLNLLSVEGCNCEWYRRVETHIPAVHGIIIITR
jgi:hypothetical protein